MSAEPTSSAEFEPRIEQRQRVGSIYAISLLIATLFGVVVLGLLLVDVWQDGFGYFLPTVSDLTSEDTLRGIDSGILFTVGKKAVRWPLLVNYPSRHAEKAGLISALAGTLIVLGLTALFSFPIGVGAAVYLEEYAPPGPITNFIQININNLAGVPSIVYGMLGLVVFVRMFGLFGEDGALTRALNLPVEGRVIDITMPLTGWIVRLPFERSLLAGGLTMSLLILPIIIIASREAIRAVPQSIREAAYALGATRWQMVSRQVLPAALPGILTGTILALSRAIGETAPLIIMGAFTYIPFLPDSVFDRFTVLPVQVFNWVSLPQHEFRDLAAGGIILMLIVLLSMNGLAIYLRNRFHTEW